MAAHAPLTEYAVHRHHIRKWLRTPEIKHQVGAEGVDGRAGPIGETTYRDASVRAGTTYTYAVYAVDRAATPNVSQLSNRETVAVR